MWHRWRLNFKRSSASRRATLLCWCHRITPITSQSCTRSYASEVLKCANHSRIDWYIVSHVLLHALVPSFLTGTLFVCLTPPDFLKKCRTYPNATNVIQFAHFCLPGCRCPEPCQPVVHGARNRQPTARQPSYCSGGAPNVPGSCDFRARHARKRRRPTPQAAGSARRESAFQRGGSVGSDEGHWPRCGVAWSGAVQPTGGNCPYRSTSSWNGYISAQSTYIDYLDWLLKSSQVALAIVFLTFICAPLPMH